MTPKHQVRAQVLHKCTTGSVSRDDACTFLKISDRHLRRLLVNYKSRGVGSLIHGNTGKASSFKVPDNTRSKILTLAREGGVYCDANVSHMQQLLHEQEDIQIGRSTLDRLLKKEEVRKRSRKARTPYRSRRERKPSEGVLVQVDGSTHDWLEGRGPKMTLMGAIDDATSKIVALGFRPSEDQSGYLALWRNIALQYGLPLAIYHDKHTMLHSPQEPTIEEQLSNSEPKSQLQQMLSKLNIISIAANSPQAKGRIERLWGTLQERFIIEMRMAGINNLEEANAFLPEYIKRHNKQFAVEAKEPTTSWVALSPSMDADYYFAVQESRKVGNDNTISWKGYTLQIKRNEDRSSHRGELVTVSVNPENQVALYDKHMNKLSFKKIDSKPKPTQARQLPLTPKLGEGKPETKKPKVKEYTFNERTTPMYPHLLRESILKNHSAQNTITMA